MLRIPSSRGDTLRLSRLLVVVTVIVSHVLGATAQMSAASKLEDSFATPPQSAKTFLWWHWMNGNVSREGITRDLEAMKQIGVGGVTLFEESDRIPAGPVKYASDEHLALIRFAAEECDRLGLDFAFHNGPGWSSSGGPWITPEHAMKAISWSELQAVGGKGVQRLALPAPPTKVEAYRSPGHTYEDHDFYRDVAVVAFPTPKQSGVRLVDWMEKAMTVVPIRYGAREQTKSVPEDGIVGTDGIFLLEQVPDYKGEIGWAVPPGNWTILRIGYILTGHVNQQGPTTGGRGLDCDKLSREALDYHWEQFVGKVIASARAGGSQALSSILIDSYETDIQTWTPRMPEEFQRLRGYSLMKYLPVLTGRIVGSVAETERFLWDFRRTISELVEENYYGHFTARCHALGLKSSFEGYGYSAIFDDFDVSRQADIPMGEFWAGIYKYSHWAAKVAASASDLNGHHLVGAEAFTSGGEDAAWKWHPYTLKAQGDFYLAQGITRFYIQASAHQPWADGIKPGMTMGPHGIQMNRNNTWWSQSRVWLAYMSRVQFMLQQGQLATDYCYYYGENAPATLRTKPNSARDRLGVPWDPDGDKNPNVWFELPEGRDFHVVSQKVLEEFSVDERGWITHPSGAAYKLLVLPDENRMRLSTLKVLAKLVHDGAKLLGPRPVQSPSLAEGLAVDAQVRALAGQLWGDIDGKKVTSNRYGRGKVYHGLSPEQVLVECGLPKDFTYEALTAEGRTPRFTYQHRVVDDAEFYFVSNQRNEATAVRLYFRQQGVAPQIWHPETGLCHAAPIWETTEDGRIAVTLLAGPAESCFVVFPRHGAAHAARYVALAKDGLPVVNRATARVEPDGPGLRLVAFEAGTYELRQPDGKVAKVTHKESVSSIDMSKGWTVVFPMASVGTTSMAYDALASWSENGDDRIKYFSGSAVYTRTFEIDGGDLPEDTVAEIDLGQVAVIAELTVNGRDMGVLWKPPFRCDVTSALRPGENEVVVKVTNLWRNRLVGDALLRLAQGEKPIPRGIRNYPEIPQWVRDGGSNPLTEVTTFTTSPFYQGGEALAESGLLGPVKIQFGHNYSLQER